jgi:copper oxidase (laccase) domain-containing protein
MGPRIFDVGFVVRWAFLGQDRAANDDFTANPTSRWHCDLYALARQRLRAQGVTRVSGGDLCTYADERHFYSHRRDVQHRGLAGTGRMASLIWRT